MPKWTTDSQCATWDFTLPFQNIAGCTDETKWVANGDAEAGWNVDGWSGDDKMPKARELAKQLRKVCKRFVFQAEIGPETGRLHYQGRISLQKKERKGRSDAGGLWKLFKEHVPDLATEFVIRQHVRPTVNSERKNFDYQTKAQTRCPGTHPVDSTKRPPTRQMREFMSQPLRPFQQKLVDISKIYTKRFVDIIIDERGNSGKSTFCEYLCTQHNGVQLPACRDYDKIMQYAYSTVHGIQDDDKRENLTFLVDMPRGMKKEKLAGFFSGVEEVQNGHLWDTRYEAKKVYISRPRVFVFTNTVPDINLLSADRWQMWRVTSDFDLVPWDASTTADILAPGTTAPPADDWGIDLSGDISQERD